MKPTTVHMVDVPAKQIPPFRYAIARQAGVKKIMMTTWGGLGDVVVAAPTLAYAFKLFEGYEISLMSSFPELFTHLPFKSVVRPRTDQAAALDEDDWMVLHTNPQHGNMSRDFIAHHFTQAVDFCSLSAFQRQLPVDCRNIVLSSSDFWESCRSIRILIHPGRHWSSKTFPEAWWNEIIEGLARLYPHQVAIIGKDIDEHTGTVNVRVPEGALDMRNQLSLPNLVSLLKAARVVVTNDSSPLHIAAAGQAHILYIASCKESDYLTHWRRPGNSSSNVWGWRMQNMARDGIWNYQSSCPDRDIPLQIDQATPEMIDRILPAPGEVVNRARMLV